MPQSALKQLNTLRSCGGLLSRLAYARARREGADVDALLHRSGLTGRAIKDKDTPLAVRNQIKFVELVADGIDDKILGFHLAYTFDPREVGLLYYVAASADTLWESLLRVERYSALANDGIVLTVKKGNLIRVRFQYAGVPRHTDTHQIEFWMASLIRICRRLTGRDLKPVHVRIIHPRADDRRDIAKLLDADIETGADVDEIEFPVEVGEFPLVTADPYLNRLCVQCCEETLARRETKGSSLKVKVENAIAAILPHRKIRIDIVAAKLGLSSKTLARRLSSEDCSFAQILNDLRSALAHRYLADRSLTISEIAWLLGYAEIGAFTRAFQRWTGMTPSAARISRQRTNYRPIKSNLMSNNGKNRQISDRK
ncbi:MAG TPA: AraC family transcriptional regulator ligand-binding domain-containing protein [Acidobacteriota bacterium]|nr:AraC family transcriptional regulator ligand-binding domain-containing protein [Acidobacteriota bacterium]